MFQEVKNGWPESICFECIDLLKSAYIFKTKYEESQVILANIPPTPEPTETEIKIEENVIKKEESPQPPVNVFELDLAGLKAHFCGRKRARKQAIASKQSPTSKTALITKNLVPTPTNNETKSTSQLKSLSVPQKVPPKTPPPLLHPCPVCTIELPASELRKHALTHRALKKYTNISKDLLNVQQTTRYIATQRDTNAPSFYQSENIQHMCPYCDETFSVTNFRAHLEAHRHQNEFKCDKCNRVFRKLNHLNIHRIRHLKEFPYKCDQCGKGFVIEKNYDCHILTHKKELLPHECQYCYKRFSNPEHLKRHQFIHTETVSYSVKYKVLKCSHCLKSFKDKEELKGHDCVPIAQRTSHNRHPCRKCNKVFKHSSGLSNHNRVVHQMKPVKVLCSVCGSYVSNIYNHMMRHSGEKPYACNQCEKKFGSKPQLKQHLLVHSGLKPFVCSVCGKAFNNLYNLQVHERMHKGDRCHICPVCSKGFLEKSYLKKHMNVHKTV